MIPVSEALDRVFDLVQPLGAERVQLRDGAGRVLSGPIEARRAQPPFPAAAMDGYAISARSVSKGDRFRVIGESAAGHGFAGKVSKDEAVRIFTGAPVPDGAVRIVIQEDVDRTCDTITLRDGLDTSDHVRPAGSDFAAGVSFDPRRRLGPADLALLAAMNHAEISVHRRPEVALIATGDELVMPGEEPRPDQIVASNTFGLAAMIEAAGGIARILPIAGDTMGALSAAFNLASDADLIVTIGGASVGDHDLVAQAAASRGMAREFYKVAMRPGKPLMAGRLGGIPMLGLPGNPVSAMVCGTIFMIPALNVMLGLPAGAAPRAPCRLAGPLKANGPREHYMRARSTPEGAAVFEQQDSARLGILAASDLLVVRPPHDPARKAGDLVEVIHI